MVTTPPPLFDLKHRALSHDRCAPNFSTHDFLFDWTERELLSRLQDIKRDFQTVLHIGNRTAGHFSPLSPALTMKNFSTETEMLEAPRNAFALALSALDLHARNDLPGALIQIRQSLKPDGLFLGAMFGGETLHELRTSLTQTELALKGGVSPRVFPFADKQQMGALLQRAGFALPVVDSEILTVTYDNAFKLMHDVRGMGEKNSLAARNKTYAGKQFFQEMARYYADHFSEPDGKIRASFEIIFLLGWAPHDSQPKPLARGSAQKHLSEIL